VPIPARSFFPNKNGVTIFNDINHHPRHLREVSTGSFLNPPRSSGIHHKVFAFTGSPDWPNRRSAARQPAARAGARPRAKHVGPLTCR
jgi:hypothetical protein